MDVETSEWKSLAATPDSTLALIDQMDVEFHELDDPTYIDVIEKLKKTFHIVNVHFNNNVVPVVERAVPHGRIRAAVREQAPRRPRHREPVGRSPERARRPEQRVDARLPGRRLVRPARTHLKTPSGSFEMSVLPEKTVEHSSQKALRGFLRCALAGN
jgi:hypothetical protein